MVMEDAFLANFHRHFGAACNRSLRSGEWSLDQEEYMANDSCDPTPTPSEPVKPGTRMVNCVKIGKELPGLDRVPWKGELGQRVFENVSKEAWKLWVEYSKMVMNEYRLNPLDPNSQKLWASRW